MGFGRCLLATILVLASAVSRADTFALTQFFETSPTPPSGENYPIGEQVSGTVTINTVTGQVTGVNLTLREDFNPHDTPTYTFGGPGYVLTQDVETFPPGYASFPLPPVASFSWYNTTGPVGSPSLSTQAPLLATRAAIFAYRPSRSGCPSPAMDRAAG